ncbi:MAG TPA: serine hydrolase domain-containing protein [Gemmatimonadaceae bacterium]|jgi:CubicO group peptidase (beta-lactamase class C family)
MIKSIRARVALVLAGLMMLVTSGSAIALPTRVSPPPFFGEDNGNSAPTGWWIYTGQSLNDIKATINAKKARIVDIAVDNPNAFTVTYVANSGTYAKGWWFYVGIDAATVTANLKTNNARLISLKAYESGGKTQFAVVMVVNTGADAKGWWWYYGKSTTDLTNLTKANNARLTSVQSYAAGGSTVYSAIMIANTGADAKGWWWYYNNTPTDITNLVSTNKARLISLTPASSGRFNAVMESCAGGCPGWWWYYGIDTKGLVDYPMDNGARVNTASSYPCGSSKCFVTTLISNVPNDVVSCDASGCISQAKLAQNICGSLAGKVVGYACEVGQVRPGYGGQARTPTDTKLDMMPHLVTNIASVTKTITAVAIIKMLTSKGLTVDTKISPYIYSEWTKGSNIGQLTFRHLLTHSSGFTQAGDCGGKINYAGIKAMIAGGVTTANIGQPSYGNCNFAMLRELMLVMSGVSLKPDGDQRAAQSANAYINYINANVFQPIGVSTSACKPPSGKNDVLSYKNPAGSAAGTDWGDWTLSCGGGGWVISANDIFRVVNDVATGSTLLTAKQRKDMIQGNLGWDSAVRSDCPTTSGVCKNGDLADGNGRKVWTYAGVLKCNVPVVVVVNSPLPAANEANGDIIGLVAAALAKSTVPGTAHACPS